MPTIERLGFSDADAAALNEIVSDIERVQREIAALEVRRTRLYARAGGLAQKQSQGRSAKVAAHDMALRGIAAELAGATRTSDRSMQRQIDDARELVEHYPVTVSAWERGEITRGHVRVIVDAGAALPTEARGEFETDAVEMCLDDTPGRVKAGVALLAERLHPRTLAQRHQDARHTRTVQVFPLGDGMSELRTIQPTVVAEGIYDRLTHMGRSIVDARGSRTPSGAENSGSGVGPLAGGAVTRVTEDDAAADDPTADSTAADVTASDTRTMDQIRADVLAQLLLAADPLVDTFVPGDGRGALGAIRAKVQVVVPALTLLERDEGPSDLVGRSPIDPATARALAGTSGRWWERLVTHPVTGQVLHTDSYERTADIDRYLRGRDQHCRFPGCRVAAIRCEVDHTHDFALGGRTAVANLSHLCQRHHSMKQFTAWRVRQLEHGVLEWTSPLGRIYVDEPPTLGVHFAPLAEDLAAAPF
ncbi:hypothetical protein GCM10009808_18010 [Microbacterium sediminicola]|uniref:HNH nuclease domain-containing protein n=1 Tax=Microbacterium sediminicola TaxID=415210 RepID=A0ABN2I977_9MICO